MKNRIWLPLVAAFVVLVLLFSSCGGQALSADNGQAAFKVESFDWGNIKRYTFDNGDRCYKTSDQLRCFNGQREGE